VRFAAVAVRVGEEVGGLVDEVGMEGKRRIEWTERVFDERELCLCKTRGRKPP